MAFQAVKGDTLLRQVSIFCLLWLQVYFADINWQVGDEGKQHTTAVLRQLGATNKALAAVTTLVYSFSRTNKAGQQNKFCTLVHLLAAVQG